MAPLLAHYDPTALAGGEVLRAPGLQHLLGTDHLGRDIFSRVVYGARLSVYVAMVSVGMGSLLGGILGLVSGYRGGLADTIIQRLVDALMALPTLVLALAIITALGAGLHNVVLAIGVAQVPWASRVVRATALAARESQHVEAARATGCSDFRIMTVHILPQCLAPFLVVATAALGAAIIAEASLSFLGLGVPPPAPSWGGMLSGPARDYARVAPWVALAPGVAISLAVYGFNLLGDALRDALDPRLRGV
jgi:peptide/nickel transport system permease protein